VEDSIPYLDIYNRIVFFLRKNIYVVCRLRMYPLSKLRFRSTPGHLGNPLLGLLNKEALVLIANSAQTEYCTTFLCVLGCFINDTLQKKKMQYQYAPLTGVYKPDMKEFFS